MAALPVLSVASEAVPLVKTGGLADVVGALPAALIPEDVGMQIILPAYPGLLPRLTSPKVVWDDPDLFGGPARVLRGVVEGTTFLLLDAPHLYDRQGGIYAGANGDYPDNPERFAALSWAAAQIAMRGTSDGWRPRILHAHDWQGGLAPAYLRYAGSDVKSVLTIHNIAFQGNAPADRLAALRLPASEFHREGLEYWGGISTLKAGLVTADALTTVSPTYAEELMRPQFGMGLEGVVASRADVLHGILNGVDEAVWSPGADPAILRDYGPASLARKAQNRAALLAEFGLSELPGPLAIVVSRLTHQKGIDLLAETMPAFIAAGGGLVLLGSGEPALEAGMRDLAARHPDRVGVRIGYDEALSHRMFAGGDAILVPSRFEPCGLTQMYGLRYGAVPVVAATGGLNDTVIGLTPAAEAVATGISFHPVDATAFAAALRRLSALYADRAGWTALVRRAMKAQVGWQEPAGQYAALYRNLLT
ncbi:glycogen synthase GlgA [Paracoccus pacificus]|uniref:Glycogen synthase n=1 Tax=Paracoccus pacificus TaxID=1463598 RepID=A0ABW4R2L9_9RHOB